MYRILIIAAVAAVTFARPELYKEQEDFKFSRSSTDEGSKSGYYGAQRGNMGGNYERAHNMDSLAQNQMSGLVRQVEGELGDGANTRTGSVYTAANSRGLYGSGHYDLGNLAGRNFQEGTSYGSSNSHASQTQSKSTFSNAGNAHNYGGSRHSGYHRATADGHIQTDDLQSLDNTQSNNQFEYGRAASHSSGYQSHSGFQKHSEYDSSNLDANSGYGSNVRTRLVSATPVRIVLTPGGRVAIPIAAQTYDASRGSSAFDHNTLNSEAVLSENNHGTSYAPTNAKSYESSYSYNKKWEKHDTIPSADIGVSHTANPIPRNSELYEDSGARNQLNSGIDSQSAHANSATGRYSAVKSSSSNSRYQSNYNTQQRSDSAISNENTYDQARYHAGSNHDALTSSSNNYHGQYGARHHGASSSSSDAASQTEYNARSHSDLNSQVEDLNLKPKSYQSSYSYHKSWERQGDPYTIYPATNGNSDSQSSQRLTSSSKSGTHHSRVSHGYNLEDCDCDENGHIRVARSYNTGNDEQQSQNEWGNLEDLTQQSQSNWDQQTQDKLEDLNQQSQRNWDQQNEDQQTQHRLEDLNQQSQNNWDQENGGQQTQDRWENLEDLNQQTQTTIDQQSDVQQSQNNWDKVEDLAQKIHTNNEQKTTLNKLTRNINNTYFGKHSSNILGEYSQAFETELGFKSPEVAKIAEDQLWESKQQNLNYDTPWDNFDTQQVPNKSDSDQETQNIENNAFNWYQSSDHIAQQESIMDPPKTTSNSSFSYSDGFTKLVLNEHPNNEGINRVFRGPYPSQIEEITQHAHTHKAVNITQINDVQSTSQIPPLLKFWNKFENLEKSSGLSTQVKYSKSDQTYQTHSSVPSSSQNISTSTYQSWPTVNDKVSTHRNENSESSKYNHSETNFANEADQLNFQPGVGHTLPTFKQSLLPVVVPIDSEPKKNQGPESPQDVGRGDISPEDTMSEIDDDQILHKTSSITSDKRKDKHNELHSDQKAISNQNQQKKQKGQIFENNYERTQQNTYNSNQKNEQDLKQGNIEIEQHLDEINNSYVLDYEQHSEDLKIKRRDNIQQEIRKQNSDKQLQSFIEANPTEIQDFGPQKVNVTLQNSQDTTGNEMVEDISQQSLTQQNTTFRHKNSDSFQQHNKNLEQQESHFLEDLTDFVQENEELNKRDNAEDQEDNVVDNFDNDYVKYIGAEDEHIEQLGVNVDNAQSEHEQVYGQQFLQPQQVQNRFAFTRTLQKPDQTNTESYFKEQSAHEIVNNEPVEEQQKNALSEKRSIWKSLSNKFSSVKKRVASWFNHNTDNNNLANMS